MCVPGQLNGLTVTEIAETELNFEFLNQTADRKPRQQSYLLFDAMDNDGRVLPTQPSKKGWNTHTYDVFVSATLEINGTRFLTNRALLKKK